MRHPWRNPAARRVLVGSMHSVGHWRAKSTFAEHLARRDIANPFQGLPALEATIGRSIVARIGSSSLSHSPPPIHHPPSFSRAHCVRDEHPHRACGRAHGACMIRTTLTFKQHGHICIYMPPHLHRYVYMYVSCRHTYMYV